MIIVKHLNHQELMHLLNDYSHIVSRMENGFISSERKQEFKNYVNAINKELSKRGL
jgi:hypothetical protein